MTEPYPMWIDRRDAEVVKRLEEGETYPVTHIRNLYLRYTDITREDTAKERKKSLVESPAFTYTGRIGYYNFDGFGEQQEPNES